MEGGRGTCRLSNGALSCEMEQEGAEVVVGGFVNECCTPVLGLWLLNLFLMTMPDMVVFMWG